MNIDTDLRTTVPDDLAALDHEHLQTRGRRRRIGTRVAGGLGALAIIAGAVGVVSTLATPSPSIAPVAPGETAPGQDGVEAERQAAEEAAAREAEEAMANAEAEREAAAAADQRARNEETIRTAIAAADREAAERGRATPDPQVVADFAALSSAEAIDRLVGQLAPIEDGDTEEHLAVNSSIVQAGEHPDEWSRIDRSILGRGVHEFHRAELQDGTSTSQVRQLLPTILPADVAVGDEGPSWFVTEPYAEETPPGSWLSDDVFEWLPPAEQAADGPREGRTPTAEQMTPTPTEAPEEDPETALDPAAARSGNLLARLQQAEVSPRVMTDLLDRTVVALRAEFEADGVTETLDVQFDPDTGRLTGAEAVIQVPTDDPGGPLVRTEATVIR